MAKDKTQAQTIAQIARDSAEGVRDYVNDQVIGLSNAGVIPAGGRMDFAAVLWVAIGCLASEQKAIVETILKRRGDQGGKG